MCIWLAQRYLNNASGNDSIEIFIRIKSARNYIFNHEGALPFNFVIFFEVRHLQERAGWEGVELIIRYNCFTKDSFRQTSNEPLFWRKNVHLWSPITHFETPLNISYERNLEVRILKMSLFGLKKPRIVFGSFPTFLLIGSRIWRKPRVSTIWFFEKFEIENFNVLAQNFMLVSTRNPSESDKFKIKLLIVRGHLSNTKSINRFFIGVLVDQIFWITFHQCIGRSDFLNISSIFWWIFIRFFIHFLIHF